MSLTDEWLALSHRLYEKGKAIFDHSNVLESEAGTKDTTVVALTLLARTMGNFQAAVLLLENGHTVEARTMARCCYEKLFWIAALAKKGDSFVRDTCSFGGECPSLMACLRWAGVSARQKK